MPPNTNLHLVQETACDHCGLHFKTSHNERFCCAGCEFVFGLIQKEGLSHYYDIRNSNPPVCPIPARTSSGDFQYCDDPEFIKDLGSNQQEIRFYLEGLNCSACLWLLEKLPEFCPEALSARVDMAASTIHVRRKPDASFAAIAKTLDRFGYTPHPLRETEAAEIHQRRERRHDLIRIGVCGALTGNIMILAVSLYGGAQGELARQFQWLTLGLAFPILTYGAWPFYKSAFSAVRSRQLNLDVPIVIAVLAGVLVSLWAIVQQQSQVYFDSLSMLVFLLLSSRFVLKGIQIRQLKSTNLEDEFLLSSVRRLGSDGSFEKVSSRTLNVGETVQFDRDCLIPVDGVVLRGAGKIDMSVMNGESHPVTVKTDDVVLAGCRYLSGNFDVRVTEPTGATRLSQILRDTESASKAKTEFLHFSDHVSHWFIGAVLCFAAFLIVWFAPSDLHEGIARALALVIVTCPCVFGIAIPLSMTFAIRAAAKKGIVVKNADAVERLWGVKHLFFDKTGTLTSGEMSVLEADLQGEQALKIACGLEQSQLHPVARAIVRYARKSGIQPLAASEVVPLTEGGIAGKIEGQTYSIIPLDGEKYSGPDFDIQSVFGVFHGGKKIAKFTLGDQVRDESRALLAWARAKGYSTTLISGDRVRPVESCGRLLNFLRAEIHAEVSASQKSQIISCRGRTSAMIGDGANDAAALAAAGVGIAVCGSLDISLRSADVYLVRQNLMAIPLLFRIAQKTKSAIYRNLCFSAGFNIVSGSLAAFGFMTPLWAAVFMPLSSVTVLLSAVWTGRKLDRMRLDT